MDAPATPGKNYITPGGLQRVQEELRFLLTRERPAVTEVVTWAASNGDRSENADYQDRKRRAAADRWADSLSHAANRGRGSGGSGSSESGASGSEGILRRDRALCQCYAGAERVVSIVGTDEVDLDRNHISWASPLGRALLKSAAGDSVVLRAPSGTEHLDVLEVSYERISVEPFREPPGFESCQRASQADAIHLKRARATIPRNGVTVSYSTCKNNFSLIWGNGLRTPGLGPRNLDSASLCYKRSRRKPIARWASYC